MNITEEEMITYFKKFYPLFMGDKQRISNGICNLYNYKFTK